MLEAAISFPGARSLEHREALARLEAGLLRFGGARVRGDTIEAEKRTPLPPKRYARILAEKLERGHWHQVKPLSRYTDASGAPRTLPVILALSRDYALELINADTGERYAGLLDYMNGRPLRTRSPRCYNLPAWLADYLEAGTDLVPDHVVALSLLELGESARGWRALALEPPRRVLRPSWCGKDCHRFYALRPALQTLPRRYRRGGALYPAGSGEGFAEVDYSCCQPNIARIIAGLEPERDYYGSIARELALSRERVKGMVLPILHGRTRGEHVHEYGRALAPIYDELRASLPVDGERLMELEAEILRAVLLRMSAAGIPAGLPLHDSLLTAHPGPVAAFMREESERILGRPLPLRVVPAGPALAL